jgi:hypothetical protein
MGQMSIDKSRKRSGPLYVQAEGEAVTYVEECERTLMRLGAIRLPMPTARRVYRIDSTGVRRLEEPASLLGLALFFTLLGLLSALSRLRRRI